MPARELGPEELEELSKHILDTEHKKGIGIMQTNLSELTDTDVKNMFYYIDKQGYEFIHTLEVRPDDGSKYFIHRDSMRRK